MEDFIRINPVVNNKELDTAGDGIKVPIHEKLLLTINEAAAYSNIGVNRIQRLLRMPRCPFVLFVGRKKLIKRRQFEKYLEDSQFI